MEPLRRFTATSSLPFILVPPFILILFSLAPFLLLAVIAGSVHLVSMVHSDVKARVRLQEQAGLIVEAVKIAAI